MKHNNHDQKDDPAERAQYWVARMASGEMDGAELDVFKQWREADPAHNPAFEDQRAIWRAAEAAIANKLPPLPPLRKSQSLLRRLKTPTHLVRKGAALATVAATIALAMIVTPEAVLTLRADHQTSISTESFELPDGSSIILDAHSAIAIHFDSDERRIDLLQGDAWFDIAHGDNRPFRVTALGGVTEDIGTAFEVKNQQKYVIVSVTQGAVKVATSAAQGEVMLHQSERVRYTESGQLIALDNTPTSGIAAWRNGELLLDNTNIRDAVKQIGDYHRSPVIITGTIPQDRSISGVFRTDRPSEAIDLVARMGGLQVYRFAGFTFLHGSE